MVVVFFLVAFNGGWTTFNSTGLDDGEWHFVRLTTDGTDTSLYVDGVLNVTNNSSGNASTEQQLID